MKEGLKSIGTLIFGLGFFILLILVPVLIINGSLIIGGMLLPWLISSSWIVFFLNLFVFLPLSLIKKTGEFGFSAMFLSSYVFGLTLWFAGLLLTYDIWGFFGVIVGLFLGGVGVVPVGMLATLLTGEFGALLFLIALVVLTFGLRVLSLYLGTRHDIKEYQVHKEDIRDVEYKEIN